MRSQERQAERQAVKEQAAKQRRVKIKDDDDEVEILSMTTSGSTPSASRKRKHGNHLLTPESSVKKHHREKRHRRHSAESDDDLFVGQHRSQSDPFSNRSDGESERDKNRRSIQLSPPGDNTCTIFVGNDQVPFLVSKEGVGACDFLANNVAFSEELKTHIELDEHSDITAKDFFPIADFLHKGDFEPVLINGDSLHRRLKGVALPDEKDRAAVMVSKVFLNAGKLWYEALQQLCVDKLKVLYPLSLDTLLTVMMISARADTHGSDAGEELKEWLADHCAEYFWVLVKEKGPTFKRLMCENAEMRRCVLEKLGQNSNLGISMDD